MADLLPGRHYRLCLDVDGLGSLYSTGQSSITQIYISPIISAYTGVQTLNTVQDQVLDVRCTATAECSSLTVWYLTAGTCGESGDASLQPQQISPAQATGVLSASSSSGGHEARLDGAKLESGWHYRLCLDLDGVGEKYWPGDTLVQVFASGILALAPPQILVSPSETMFFQCAPMGCSADAMVWLAPDCGSVAVTPPAALNVSGLQASAVLDTSSAPAGQMLELCYQGAGLLPGGTRLFVYLSGILAVHPWIQTWVGRLSVECATSACDTASEAYLGLQCESRPGSLPPTAAAQLVQDGDEHTTVLDLSPLIAGVHYRLCTDLDGPGPLPAFFSSFSVFVTRVRQSALHLVAKQVARYPLLLDCDPAGCPGAVAEAFAAENCSAQPQPGDRLTTEGARRIATVDASSLTARWYYLCFDEDGKASAALHPGPVGHLFVSPVSAVWPGTLAAGGLRTLMLNCTSCEGAAVFLSATCTSHNASSALEPLGFGSSMAMLDTSSVDPGFYRLCVKDLAGNVTGPSGEAVFVAPELALQQAGVLQGIAEVRIDCAGCGLLHFALATACPSWDPLYQVPMSSAASIFSPTVVTVASGPVSLDASGLPAGRMARLCVGSEDFPMGDGGLSLFVSPVSAVSVDVLTAAAAPQSFQLSCAGCSSMTQAFLSVNCSEDTEWGDTSDTNDRTPASNLAGVSGGEWWAAINTTSLEPGSYYDLCVDLDGEGEEYPTGPSQFQFYASAFAPQRFSLPLSPTAQLKVSCASCVSAQGFLGSCVPRDLQPEDAGNPDNRSRPVSECLGGTGTSTDAWPFLPHGEDFVLELDTCNLLPGSYLWLCTDMDGLSSRQQIGNSSIEVYVSPVTSLVGPSRFLKGSQSQMTITCPSCVAGVTTVQLAFQCHGSPVAVSPSSTGAVGLQAGSQGWTASFDTRGLSSGRPYRLCVDLDGSGSMYRAGDSGFTLSVTAVASISLSDEESAPQPSLGRRLASATTGRLLSLEMLCLPGPGGCGSHTEGFLSLVGNCTAVSEPHNLQPLQSYFGLAFERFGLSLSTTLLPAGYTYQVCVDIDGPGALPAADTGFTVYMSPVQMAASWGDSLYVLCAQGGCSEQTSGFLSSDCSITTPAATLTAPQSGTWAKWAKLLYLANESAVHEWQLSAPAPSGRPQRLCLDVDGAGPMPSGDAAGVFVSEIQDLFTEGVAQGMDAVTFACTTGRCSEMSQAYLAKTCDIHDLDASAVEVLGERTAAVLFVPDNVTEAANNTEVFSVHLRTDGLHAGWHYRLCVDLDGAALDLPMGDTQHKVYLSPLQQVEARATAGDVQLSFTCLDCTELSEGFLSQDCYRTVLARSKNATEDSDSESLREAGNESEVSATAPTAFMAGLTWSVNLSTIDLMGGLSYRLCVDLDGPESSRLVGDTGLRVFVSPVTAVEPTLLTPGNSSLILVCERGGCDFLTEGYLAESCQNPPESCEDTANSTLVGATPMSTIKAKSPAERSLELDLACTKLGRYRLCIVGRTESFGVVTTSIQEAGFDIDIS
ncbi:unnamed protein product [Effrenium voratum]|uniref:Uncharacterized protein n=1 Tax=Effrenium voratum TaxID=2562239 RepID=A0AA36NBP1_9DINO|nr:unnamed protein product [Effrenium voratum]